VDDQSGSKFSDASTGCRELAPAKAATPEVPTIPPTAAMTDDANDAYITRKWLRLPGAQLLAEYWFAWRTSNELLDSYNRMRREEPQLIGRALYERIVMRRSDLDVKVAAGVLQRAEQSFCQWPYARDLRFRDLVRYIVIGEYLRSHVAIGTRTNLEKVVVRVIPEEL
jgi:hypothetical protein